VQPLYFFESTDLMARRLEADLVLETERFALRQLRGSDASLLQAGWTLDPTAAEMLNTQLEEWSVEAQTRFFERHLSGDPKFLLGIFVRETSQLVGIVILTLQYDDGMFTSSIVIGPKSWRGLRVAAEISKPLHHHLFNVLGFLKAKANVRPQNKPMLWLLLQQGCWKKEATLKNHIYDQQTRLRGDLLVFGMLADEWRHSVHAASTSFLPFRTKI
jgi:RimJ/RimL family protein N-acetyltransferase